jgi:glycosyltransferase involved in cell wall biosynthesis
MWRLVAPSSFSQRPAIEPKPDLATGLPVITKVPGEVARIVEEAKGGVLVPPSDPVALADAIQEFASREPWRTDAPDYIREHHDRRKLAQDLAKVIESVRRRT